MTGLFYGAKMALTGYEEIIDEIQSDTKTVDLNDYYSILHRYSSEIFPILPEYVLKIFHARAMVSSGEQHLVSEGVQRLESLRQINLDANNYDYERSMLEIALLEGHKALGDVEQAAIAAIRVAGILVVGRSTK